MRFIAPTTLSGSPARRSPGKGVTFSAALDDDEYSESSEAESTASGPSSSSSSDSFCYESESDVPAAPVRKVHMKRTLAERRKMEDTVASIKLRTRHRDVYDEWTKDTRKDALRTASREHAETQDVLAQTQAERHTDRLKRMLVAYEGARVQAADRLRMVEAKCAEHARTQQGRWDAKSRDTKARIEAAIRVEEEQVRAAQEEERKKREEVEKKKREEVERRLAEERRKAEEQKKRLEEEAERKRKEEEELEQKKKLEEVDNVKKERDQQEETERKQLGLTTAEEDWLFGRRTLIALKTGSMKTVKGNKELKSAWSAIRRQITPKIGQLTNDPQTINRVSEQIFALLRPTPPLNDDVYGAALSSLAKAVLLQAETEVTAEKRAARPLAAVVTNLLGALPSFADVLWAKTLQRAGGWPVPATVPTVDADGTTFTDAARRKAAGWREGEGRGEYGTRVAGIVRVYFEILKASPNTSEPLHPGFRFPRIWGWMARILGSPKLLVVDVTPQLIFVALDVLGTDAKVVWGKQWIKVLALLYQSVTEGIGGDARLSVGGESAEGKAARVRVQLEIERIMAA